MTQTEDFINVANVTGTPPVGPDVTDTDDAPVDVIHPDILITKSPDIVTVVMGDLATFIIYVENTGDVGLTNVEVNDLLAPNCNRTIGNLAAGVSTSYECTVTATTNFINTAIATGDDPTGDPVSDDDIAEVVLVQDLCEDKHPPTTLLMQYDGTDDEVYIVVEHPKDGVIFEGDVDAGGMFEMSREKQKLNPELWVTIYSDDPDEGGIPIDSFVIHTSCSLPLYIGQTFGTNQNVAEITILGEPL